MTAVEEQELTTSAGMTKNSAEMVHVRSLATFLLSVFGLPGNALVIAVYARQTKTSTRAYMFALAVADLAVCICAIVLTRVAMNHLELQIVVWVGHSTVTFSALLLAFVSVERLLAVRRPHSFSLSVERRELWQGSWWPPSPAQPCSQSLECSTTNCCFASCPRL